MQAIASKERNDVLTTAKLRPTCKYVRLLVSGDVYMGDGITLDHEFIGDVVGMARANPSVVVYGYTHARALFEQYPAATWPGNVVWRLSADTPDDVSWAKSHGVPYARIADNPVTDRRAGEVACPHYAHGTTCDRCRACMKSSNVVLARI